MSYTLDEACDLLQCDVYGYDIDVSGQNIDDTGAKRLAEAIIEYQGIFESLDLAGNNITLKGMKYILDALKGNSTLQMLQLNSNNFANPGEPVKDIKYYIELLKKFADNDVSTLDLTYTNIDANFIQALIEVLPKTNIRELYITGNNLTSNIKCKISNILYVNRLNYNNHLWAPKRHSSFVYNYPDLHKTIMAVLLCGSAMPKYIPMHIWISIFSFWRRYHFINILYFDNYDTTDDEAEDDE